MFIYEKRLQYPVNIKTTDAKLATAIITQLGGLYTISYSFSFLHQYGEFCPCLNTAGSVRLSVRSCLRIRILKIFQQ